MQIAWALQSTVDILRDKFQMESSQKRTGNLMSTAGDDNV